MIIIFKKSYRLYHVFLRQIIFFNPYQNCRIYLQNTVLKQLIMKLTTKGRYAVMAMADLALFKDKGPISLTDISLRQNISLAYLEQIFIKLKNNNLVNSVRGAKGGYVLEKSPEEIKISKIISAVDEEIKTLNCKKESKKGCNNKSSKCITHNLWDQLDQHINSFFEKVKLQDLVKKNQITNK